MSLRPPRPPLLLLPIALYGLVGFANLRTLLVILPDAGRIPLLDLLAVALWTILPLGLAVCLGLRLRWAWWVGLLAPPVLILVMVGVLGAFYLTAEDGALIGFAGGFGSILSTLGLIVAAGSLLVPSVRRWFSRQNIL
ncbi:MAG TPA: hypothetical protein VFU23_16915 [Gemmatimonadales bacterium]|nr:hypothetical protein [Gemmatimonadales bacterium]